MLRLPQSEAGFELECGAELYGLRLASDVGRGSPVYTLNKVPAGLWVWTYVLLTHNEVSTRAIRPRVIMRASCLVICRRCEGKVGKVSFDQSRLSERRLAYVVRAAVFFYGHKVLSSAFAVLAHEVQEISYVFGVVPLENQVLLQSVVNLEQGLKVKLLGVTPPVDCLALICDLLEDRESDHGLIVIVVQPVDRESQCVCLVAESCADRALCLGPDAGPVNHLRRWCSNFTAHFVKNKKEILSSLLMGRATVLPPYALRGILPDPTFDHYLFKGLRSKRTGWWIGNHRNGFVLAPVALCVLLCGLSFRFLVVEHFYCDTAFFPELGRRV